MLIGELFSLISLAAGLFFFIFAARYYFSIAFVMVRKNRIENRNNRLNNFNNHWRNNNNHNGARNGLNNNNSGKTLHNGGTHLELFRTEKGEGHANGVLTRLVGWLGRRILLNGGSSVNGENGENGSSRSVNNRNKNNHNNHQPFVSIHLAFYNEKNVADRILTACTSLSYTNFEVIVVDDSKDETVEILKKWQDNPRVKVIHREARKGWKGGALNEALKRMDPRAEYVMVFDADFIPPTDIIQQFLPYFSQGMGINGNNHNNHNGNGNGLNNNHANNHLLNNHRTVNRNDYQRIIQKLESWYEKRELAVVQGYQWHYLNAGENWLTKGIRAEYSSSYVIERTYQELTDAMKMISGSVFMIKADVLKKHGWSTSMTEDWELTVRLYLDGYKVAYTPYIQAPCECPSTIPQLVKQRMRWAEGHTYNAKKYFSEVIRSPKLSLMEKLEYAYYAPYYLQTFIFLIGTAFWFLSETMHQYLPFWTQVFGWSLLLTNLLSLPMMGLTGLFLEKNVQRDLTGIFSFIVMSYVLVPFMAYASLKGLLEKKERGTWIRTLKTGKITELITKLELRKVWRELLPRRRKAKATKVATKANGGAPAAEAIGQGRDEKSKVKGGKSSEDGRRLFRYSWLRGKKKGKPIFALLIVTTFLIMSLFALGTTITPVKAAVPDLYFHGASPGTMNEITGSSTITLDTSPGSSGSFSVRFDLQGGVDHDTTIDTTYSSIYVWMRVTKTGETGTASVSFTIYDTESGSIIASGSGGPYLLTSTAAESRVYVTSGGTLPAWHRMYISISFSFTMTGAGNKGRFQWDNTQANSADSELYIYGATIPENAVLAVFFVIVIPYIARRRCTVNLFPKKTSHRHKCS